MMPEIDVMLYDAFTSRLMQGNIAGVVPVSSDLSGPQMQSIARELAAPTTGFVMETGPGKYEIRFFTPSVEIDMCDHVLIGVLSAIGDLEWLATS